MSLIDHSTHVVYDILSASGYHTLLDTLSMSFQYIEDIERRVNNKCQLINMTATHRLKVLKSFSIHDDWMKIALRMTD